MIRVLIVDDQALIRGGFRLILERRPTSKWWARQSDGREGLEQARALEPDVVLMDVRMPELDGIEATRQLLAGGSQALVLILTTFDADEHVYDAMKAGASGFLLKDVRPEQLADAVRVVAAGDALLAPVITRRLVEQFVRRPPPGARAPCAARGAHGARTRRPPRGGARALQRGDRQEPVRERGDRQDAYHPHPHEARPPRPRAGGRPGLRVGLVQAGVAASG
jgi:DNA-binding NarL/FixJ family response regulator